jgi:hypothetical protein
MAEHPLDEITKVSRRGPLAQVVTLALHDVGRKVRWRRRGLIGRQEADIPDEHAADDRIFARRDRSAAVGADPRQHLLQAGGAIALAEQRPGKPARTRSRLALARRLDADQEVGHTDLDVLHIHY